ncbi:acyltransferase [Escherichia coli]|uniref:acyltransferase family protein n=1 Tax=Escherichia coli TaxID=562 RepID=UPI0017A3E852|nr:acyltransferase [Escherichia coli]EFB3384739.1 acyltransferase [Escherichia coli]EHD1533907.1 acyltransferase [Escherichia coli]EKL6965116.1 acyltransferase [Escherichia coli]EKM2999378.1 acyltransferase [Escherichia coli]EKP1667283.1 acyltransferase [Escherichia coli]
MIFEAQSLYLYFLSLLAVVLCITLLTRYNYFSHINFSGNRYFFIDGLRGIAAFSVLMNHGAHTIITNGVQPTFIDFTKYSITGNMGSFGVQLFFCITGFLFFDKLIKSNNVFDWNKFFVARIKRLVPLYMLTSLLVAILAIILAGNSAKLNFVNFSSLLNFFGFGFLGTEIFIGGFNASGLNAVIWTLPYEWRFYLLFPLVSIAISSKKYGILALSAVMLLAARDFMTEFVLWPYFIVGAFGAYIFNKTKMDIKDEYWIFSFITCAAIFLIICSSADSYGRIRFACISLLFIIVLITKPKIFKTKSLVYLGEASYSLYLLHLPIMAIVMRTINSFYNLSSMSTANYTVLVAFIASLCSVISCICFKHFEWRFIKK